ncbi:uncharacterized protein LOC106866407 isoform X1 [Brachypodium distachyon]|uniref:Neprosin PEP catalytic domain-containing protein n=1 Tax=Brachypodium distachyon TaxID=15368 RepID=A0A2K2D0V8_BRADI|nr:uncharacterized protein LOC106866407 isoform X1 [Brachypodium distachyon]PNT67911.1 hypothetical protein BRADI_3g33616v3 [Brachypodium distachyon]|eukprot:XP_024318017.1 uncharacterized protein LOC106866407 isoform X1 [Brachypodium distachyon]
MLQHIAIALVIFLSYIALASGDGESDHQDAVKTVLIEDGDLFKCIDINQQPTLKHPLLKNHKVQMKPSSYPYELDNRSLSVATNSSAQLPAISCPRGTIPMLHGSKGYTKKFGGFRRRKGRQHKGPHGELAIIKTIDDFYGSRVSINVHEPKVKEKTEDKSASWVLLLNSQNVSHREAVGAGSIVWPSFSGDNFARFHITWSDSAHDNLCFDHRCPGFVQVNSRIGLGSRIQPISVYNGPQHFIDVLLFKDLKTKDWWVALGGTPIGYWPSSIFSHLKDKATEAGWGGHVHGPTVQSNFPQMGSGHFGWEGFGKAAYVSNIKIIDENNKYYTPNNDKTFARSSKPSCYPIDNFGQDEGGMHLYYGGPGGCNNIKS